LYANHKSAYKTIQDSEKELLFSVGKSHDLYLLVLALLVDIAHQAGLKAELVENREVNDKSDAVKYAAIANNTVVKAIASNRDLQKKLTTGGLIWNDNILLVKEYMQQIVESLIFNKYLDKPKTLTNDKKFVLDVTTDIIPLNEGLYSYLEERSIYWNDDIEFILEMVVKTIRSITQENLNSFEILPLFNSDEDKDFLLTLFRKTITQFDSFTKVIEKHLENWNLDRIAEIDLLLIKMAIVESIEFPNIPIKVTLNEYIEIAKYYSTEKSGLFINGIIDRVLKELIDNKTIQKTGRGLID